MAMTTLHVGVLVGSLRKGSLSRKMAKALIARAPSHLECEIIEIGDLPMYDADLDSSPPKAWTELRAAIKKCDALLFVTPEYNRGIPGCLKNATDIGSRPEGENVFDGLPAAVVSVSPYASGGFGANHALRATFVYLNLLVMQQPEAYIGNVEDVMSSHGGITNAKTEKILKTFMEAFADWAVRAPNPAEPFDKFLERREAVSNEFIRGDAGSLIEMSSEDSSATFMPPSGEHMKGATKINAANEAGAKSFGKGSTGHFEILQSGSNGGLGFWTGIQHANVEVKGKDEKVKMQLRVTEVFRLERGQWKLVHRHADAGDH